MAVAKHAPALLKQACCAPGHEDYPTCWSTSPEQVCTAWGDPHYTTFDGYKYDFMGPCEYVFAKDCRPAAPANAFEVQVQNSELYRRRVTYTLAVAVYVPGLGLIQLVNRNLDRWYAAHGASAGRPQRRAAAAPHTQRINPARCGSSRRPLPARASPVGSPASTSSSSVPHQ